MLVLTRKVDERIIINDNITIQIVEVGRNKVRIGVIAPTDVKVIRGELLERKERDDHAEGN